MWNYEIVEEVRRMREAHAAAHGNDLRRIFQDLKQTQDASGRKAVTLQPRSPHRPKRAAGTTQR
jgi:bisphosphoglycerate-dependent phosphoglycerate mutase